MGKHFFISCCYNDGDWSSDWLDTNGEICPKQPNNELLADVDHETCWFHERKGWYNEDDHQWESNEIIWCFVRSWRFPKYLIIHGDLINQPNYDFIRPLMCWVISVWGYPKLAGSLISWNIRKQNGWWLGVALFPETSIYGWRKKRCDAPVLLGYRWFQDS